MTKWFYIALFLEIISIIFAIFKGKAVVFLCDKNSKLKKKIEKSDVEKLSKNVSNYTFVCGLIVIFGIIVFF